MSGAAALDHLAQATLAPSEAVAAELERAARLELAAAEIVTAVRHAEAAWRLSPPGATRRRRALLAMEAELATGLPRAARAHVAEVEGEDPDPERDHLLGWLARSEGRFVVADHFLRRAEVALDARPEPDVTPWRQRRAAVALELAQLALARMAGSDARTHGARAVELSTGSKSHPRAKAVLAAALALDGGTAHALALLDPAAPAIVDVHELAVRGVVRLWSDDCAGAHEDLATTVRRTEAGEALTVIQARSYLAETCLRMGRLDEARRVAETACEMVDESARPWQMAIDHTKAGWIAAVAGDLQGARSHRDVIGALAAGMAHPSPGDLEASDTAATFAPLRASAAASSWVAMVLALVEGDHRSLLAAAELTEDLLQQVDPGIVPFGPARAEALVGLHRLDEASECLDAYQERASRLGRKLATMDTLRVRAMLRSAAGDHAAARQAFGEAIAMGVAAAWPVPLARVRVAFGRSLLRAGDLAGARRELADAERLLLRSGAHGFRRELGEAQAELGRLGGDGGRRPLTPSERRIAALAAGGLSNPEIAKALSVTRKAVEYHLSNVFAKLGIGNRRELGKWFGSGPPVVPPPSGSEAPWL